MKNDKRFGAMLDCSRNAVMKPEKVKEFAGILRSFGYDMLMLYTEDTYEVNNEPYFGYMRGRYTKAELKDMDAYCASVGVELIPCVQTLAHLGTIFRWAPYAAINDTNDILLVDDERTYELIDNMFSTLAECFSTRRVHIGMDEAHMLGLGKYLDLHGKQNRFELLRRHLEKVMKIAAKYGFSPVMWSDMFFRLDNHGEYYPKEIKLSDEVIAAVPEGVGLVYWDYYHEDEKTYADMIDAHARLGNADWFAGGAWSWIGFAPSNGFTEKTMVPAMRVCREKGVKNIIITLWGDNGKECSFYSLLPSLYAVKKVYDGVEDETAIKQGFKEITGEDFDALTSLDLPNAIGGNNPLRNICKAMLYSDLFLGICDSAVKKGVSGIFNEHAAKLFECAENSRYGYIFDVEAKLCRLLSVKYDLGRSIREAYAAGDKAELEKLAEKIGEAEQRTEEFYLAFRNLWHTENKPHGFDVQEIRIGGMKLRLRSCRERLSEYVAGKTDCIPELEEELLDMAGGGKKFSEDDPYCYLWTGISPNVL